MRNVLCKGANSTVFIDDSEPGIVIKEQNNLEKDSTYFTRQLRGYEVIETIKKHNSNIGVILPELIRIEKYNDRQIIKEKFIPGLPFTYDMYNKLSKKQKENIAKQMAIFLNAMHSSAKCKQATESIKNMYVGYKDKLNNVNDIIAKFCQMI